MSGGAGFALDILVLVLLGVTIFYAARLSIYLKTFKDGRADLEKILQKLTANIDQAENAIQGMKNTATIAGQELQDLVNESKFLSDELRFMNEAGDNLASRLEKLAERNRELIDLIEEAGGIGHGGSYAEEQKSPPARAQKSHRYYEEEDFEPVQKSRKEEAPAPFMIQDRDFEEEMEEDEEEEDFFFTEEEEEAVSADHLSSHAERELYEALLRGKQRKRKAGGVS